MPNRRSATAFIKSKLKAYKKLDVNFALGFFDIDDFKVINDTYGHDTGDMIIKLISKTLTSSTRHSDMISRWGGEEFIAVFVGVDQEQIGYLSEKLGF